MVCGHMFGRSVFRLRLVNLNVVALQAQLTAHSTVIGADRLTILW